MGFRIEHSYIVNNILFSICRVSSIFFSIFSNFPIIFEVIGSDAAFERYPVTLPSWRFGSPYGILGHLYILSEILKIDTRYYEILENHTGIFIWGPPIDFRPEPPSGEPH